MRNGAAGCSPGSPAQRRWRLLCAAWHCPLQRVGAGQGRASACSCPASAGPPESARSFCSTPANSAPMCVQCLHRMWRSAPALGPSAPKQAQPFHRCSTFLRHNYMPMPCSTQMPAHDMCFWDCRSFFPSISSTLRITHAFDVNLWWCRQAIVSPPRRPFTGSWAGGLCWRWLLTTWR